MAKLGLSSPLLHLTKLIWHVIIDNLSEIKWYTFAYLKRFIYFLQFLKKRMAIETKLEHYVFLWIYMR